MKHFYALESDPVIFTGLAHSLGCPRYFKFEDVYDLEQPDLLLPPALALILVLPTSEAYEAHVSLDDAGRKEYSGSEENGIVFFKQTINNACGLYAILHALFNVNPEISFCKSTSEVQT